MNYYRATLLLVLILPALLYAPAQAAKSKRLQHSFLDFIAGELEGSRLDPDGWLRPAASGRLELESGQSQLWCIAQDSRGRLIVGGGDRGRILRREGANLEVVAETVALEILSLLPFGNEMLAGSSPDGAIYRFDPAAKNQAASLALDLPVQSVWSLLDLGNGSFLAGTGPGAKLFRGGAGAEAGELLAELPAENLLWMTQSGDRIFLGTQGPALLYEWVDGKAELRLALKRDELRGVIPDGEGGIYLLELQSEDDEERGLAKGSAVHWLPAGGGQEELWAGREILLAAAPRRAGGLWLSEADPSRLHWLERNGRSGMEAAFSSGTPMAIVEQDQSIALAMAEGGNLIILGEGETPPAAFQSAVIPIEHAESWGRLQATGHTEGLRFSSRSGHREEVGEGWSDWSSWKPIGQPLDSPIAPWLQYRLDFGGKPSAVVQEISLSWREYNLPPRLHSVYLEPAGENLRRGGFNGPTAPLSQRFDDGLVVEYQIQKAPAEAAAEYAAWARGIRTVVWDAEDPNGDPLRFRVELRKLPEGKFELLAEDLDASIWGLDTRAFADGDYQLRIGASDALANAVGTGREATVRSGLFRIDNRSPEFEGVQLRAEGDQWRLRGAALDQSSPLRSLDWRPGNLVDAAWSPVLPTDGVLDGRREEFDLLLPVGNIVLRAVDGAGNVQRIPVGKRP